jgi:hypothetical protein
MGLSTFASVVFVHESVNRILQQLFHGQAAKYGQDLKAIGLFGRDLDINHDRVFVGFGTLGHGYFTRC